MAVYVFYREAIYKYYVELAEFSMASRNNHENEHIKSALNMNVILSSACFVEGFMEKMAKCILGYYRLTYNEIDIPEFKLRKSMNEYFRRIEADVYQRISQCTGVDNYDLLFELLLGKSFKKNELFQPMLESIQVLFQLRNVIAHAKEVSAYSVSAYWNNNTPQEIFYGGYKKAENFLIKKGLLKEHYIGERNVECFFADAIADYFYNISQQFTEQLYAFTKSSIEVSEALINELNIYNKKNNTDLSFMDFCELNAHAINNLK